MAAKDADDTFLSRGMDALVRLFNRHAPTSRELALAPRGLVYQYDEDSLLTLNSCDFVDEPRFSSAYRRAVQAGGFDYGIRWRAHTVLWAAALAASMEGVFVECGTGRGFMMSAVCEYLNWQDRPLYLFDTFRPTMPDREGKQSAGGKVSPHYASGPDAVARNFQEWPGVKLVVGEVPATFAKTSIDRVAFLHIDMNHPLPEEAAVREFWPRMVDGGVMLLDDYGASNHRQSRLVHNALSDEFGYRILSLPTGQGLVVKEAGTLSP
jgi:hypothetical protein